MHDTGRKVDVEQATDMIVQSLSIVLELKKCTA